MLSNKRSITDLAKFIAALLVVNGHLFMYYSNAPEVTQWINLGAQCVSLFLFFSAYGLMCAYEKKGEAYLNGFFKKRIGRILIPLFTAYAVSLPLYAIFKGPIDWHNVIRTITWGGPYLKFSWYVTEIAVLYILFYICAKISRSVKMSAVCLSAAILLLIFALFVSKQPVWYINGLPCFIIGIWYQQYENQVLAFFNKHRWLLMSLFIFIFITTFQWHYFRDAVPTLSAWRYEYFAMYLSNIFFVLSIIGFLDVLPSKPINFNWGGQLILSYYEIYLLQNSMMIVFSSLNLSFSLMWVLTMFSTIFIGFVFNLLNKRISNLFFQ